MADRLWINGVDVESTMGHAITGLPGWRDPVRIEEQLLTVPGRPQSLPGPRIHQPRTLRIELRVGGTSDTWSQRAAKLDLLYSHCGAGVTEVPIRVGDQSARQIVGRLVSGNPAEMARQLLPVTGKPLLVPLEFRCRDPRWTDVSSSSVMSITTAKAVPAGTAQMGGVLVITGGTDPVLTIKDSGGVTRYTMTFAATLGGAGTITIDFGLGTIATSLTDTTGMSLWRAGFLTGEVFPRLTPDLWDFDASSWMTFALSAGSGALTYFPTWTA